MSTMWGTNSTQLIIQNRELKPSTQVCTGAGGPAGPPYFVWCGPMEGWWYAHTFPFEGLLCHSAQQQEGKCGRGFSHLGDNAGEARWERSSVLQKTEGSLTSVSSSDEKGATSWSSVKLSDKDGKDLSSCYEERKESIHAYVFEGGKTVYGKNLLLKRPPWSRFIHHQIDRCYGGYWWRFSGKKNEFPCGEAPALPFLP